MGAHCGTTFTTMKRRHHCRLCGDVFLDGCSMHRVILPLEGPEFERPVRICDFCHKDVERGNFFSWRRYLTPLHLYDPSSESGSASYNADVAGDASDGFTAGHVNAALSAMS